MATDLSGEGLEFVKREEIDVGTVSFATVDIVALLYVRKGP